jgi:hypothetical protein
MKNNEIEMLFSKPELIEKQYQENINKLVEYSERLNSYFFINHPKNPELLSIYLDKLGAGKLLKNEENIEKLHMILRSNIFFDYFSQKKLDVIILVKILTIIDKSSEYHVENEKKKEDLMRRNIKNIRNDFDSFLDSSKLVYNFDQWFSERVSDVSDILLEKNESDISSDQSDLNKFRLLFEKYFQEINNMFVNKKSFNEKDRNIRVNYFVRELNNIFNSTNSEKLPNKIIFELVSIVFNKNLDDTQIKNIIKNANKHIANTNYTLQFTTKENNNFEMEYKKPKDAL